MQKLDDIYLIEKASGRLVKQVHFFYSYRLQQGDTSGKGCVPNTDRTTTGTNGQIINARGGKLTLEAVQTFGMGGMGDTSVAVPPFRFDYGSNPAWGTKYCYDRWGYFKSDGAPWNHRDINAADQSAWCLTKITSSTGGTIQIQYEPKDYTRVQDRVPMNPRANSGQVANYLVNLDPWVNTTPWPLSEAEWSAFRVKVNGDATHAPTPFHVFPPTGTTVNGAAINPVVSSVIHSTIPIESAPNPKDLKLWLVRVQDQIYAQRQAQAAKVPAMANVPTYQVDSSTLIADADSANTQPAAPKDSAIANSTAAVERMVNVVFEYWTAGARSQKLLAHPAKVMTAADIAGSTDDDRGDRIVKSVLVRMVRTADGGADMFITDPTFEWPRQVPDSMYVTWSAFPSTPKLGGGVRVKRIVSFDGRRSYTTSYTYTDYVDGAWTSSGVAAQEPPPFGYSLSDDRVIYTEKGGWANETGGGIYHSRVVVRQSWSEDPAPAGTLMNDMVTRASSPMGESVYRFITPRDLPHQESNLNYAVTVTNDSGNKNTNSARITEIFNVGGWWGKLLWNENRDSGGHPLGRVENRYTQLEGYLRIFPKAGYDPDVEKTWGQAPRSDMSYHWADNRTVMTDGSTPANMPALVDPTTNNRSHLGKDIPDSSRGYLNTSVNVTLMNTSVTSSRAVTVSHAPRSSWTSATQSPVLTMPIDDSNATMDTPTAIGGWHSSITGIREISFAPLVAEVRTYGEGLNLLSVTRNTKWDRRTGTVLEKETRGRRSQTVPANDPFERDLNDPFKYHDRTITRLWPAYWAYPALDTGADPTAAGWSPYSVVHMLTEVGQTTTLRQKADGTSTYLNSKVETWWQPENGEKSGRWVKGGEFVWNGLGTDSALTAFPGFAANWRPDSIPSNGFQPYKASSNWIFAGATTRTDVFSHSLEAVDGDGVYGCSKYGYPYDDTGAFNTYLPLSGTGLLPGGNLPIAKFSNAQDGETLYWNFEGPSRHSLNADQMPNGNSVSHSDDPIARLANAYTGEWAHSGTLPVTLPPALQTDGYELRYFVKAGSQAAALASCQTPVAWKLAVQAEGGWWFVRAHFTNGEIPSGGSVSLSGLIDDVAAFPWRKNGAPASISHYAYDRALGLVTSITGSNGRTMRYRYDSLGRLMQTYDVFGKAVSATRYGPYASTTYTQP